MSQFTSLLSPGVILNSSATKQDSKRGCDYCPRNKVRGINKVMGQVTGKEIFVWAQSPGPDENEEERELVGRSGQWWWTELAKVGIRRKDCDVQNQVRCFPADMVGGRWKMRDPTKEEIHCCSVYTDKAVSESKAKVHLVLGKIAADNLLGKEKPKDQRVFWSKKLRGQVFLLTHPSYFIRGNAGEPLAQFRRMLKEAKQYVDGPMVGGQFAYLKQQDYRGVYTGEHARKVEKIIRAACKNGNRLVADVEDGKVNGKKVPLVYGFSIKPGWARVFVLDHPEANIAPKDRDEIRAVVCGLLSDAEIKKALQHGDYDDQSTQELLGTRLCGYDFDTNYSEYFENPGHRSYKLSEIALRRFPQFANYKEIVMPEAAPPKMTYEQAYKKGCLDFAKVPLKKLILYNGGDCDLTKRIELSTSKVSLPLLKIYVDAAYVISKMEENGPLFDSRQADALEKIYPMRIQTLRQKLQVMARDPNFNPGSPKQVEELIYDKLKLPVLDEKHKQNTRKETLERLSSYHEIPGMVLEYRGATKVKSTYIDGFRRSAEKHNGHLRTIWWMTGTTTGRLSSGGGKAEKSREDGIVNLQNIHHDEQVKNMIVSDPGWRDTYSAWKGKSSCDWLEAYLRRQIFLIYDYSQMEIRFLAASSGDPHLIELFNKGEDIHSQVGHEITGWSVESIVNDDQVRKFVKNLHFGIIYGLQGPHMLAFLEAKGVKVVNGVKLTLKRVNEVLANYFRKFKRVKQFIEHQHNFCEQHNYVVNLFGFKIPINAEEDSRWANKSVNYPIQGGAHQMLLMALVLLKRRSITYGILGTPNMEIHDALVFSNPLQNLVEAYRVGKQLLEDGVVKLVQVDFGIDWKIPLVAEAKIGFRYGVTVKYEGGSVEEAVSAWCKKNQKVRQALAADLKAAQKFIPSAAKVPSRSGLLF